MAWTCLALPVALLTCAGLALPACGGVSVPTHDGYRDSANGWERPAPLDLDEDLEVEEDSEVSYPRKRRSRWYEVKIPDNGELHMQLEHSPVGESDEVEYDEEEEAAAPFDVAFEVFDEGFKLVARADNQEDDAGERRRSRVIRNLRKGRYLIHVYVQRRLDEAEFTLQVRFRRSAIDLTTDFPRSVAFVPPLPVVPVFAPGGAEPRDKRPRPRGKRPEPDKPAQASQESQEPEELAPGALQGRVVGVREVTGEGTQITINLGSNQGIAQGMRGQVVTKAGKAIPNGAFTITSVQATRSMAMVKASHDAVNQARYVRLNPP